jgi:hypothetical protein
MINLDLPYFPTTSQYQVEDETLAGVDQTMAQIPLSMARLSCALLSPQLQTIQPIPRISNRVVIVMDVYGLSRASAPVEPTSG